MCRRIEMNPNRESSYVPNYTATKPTDTDFVQKLYDVCCENNIDMFASDVDAALKDSCEQIVNSLSKELGDKFSDILLADSQRAFRYGFSVAMKLAMQGVSV